VAEIELTDLAAICYYRRTETTHSMVLTKQEHIIMIKAVVSDIGGIFELEPLGRDPTARFPELDPVWEERLQLPPGEFRARIRKMNQHFDALGKDGEIGTQSLAEWQEGLVQFVGMTPTQLEGFVEDFWRIYLGDPNPELVAYFSALRPRYRTALLSNSFDGAREREQERHHFAEIVDFIIYSHEVGFAKPDPRIYALTSERLGVQPQEIVFLDDVERNVVAAAAYGFHAIQYKNNAQAIADIDRCLQTL
jgi:epoxide hydrolase-like predicted phosphatase